MKGMHYAPGVTQNNVVEFRGGCRLLLDMEKKFATSIFKPGSRITIARHRDCSVHLYQDHQKMWTYKYKNCGDGYIWLGHYQGSMKSSCLTDVTLCNAPAVRRKKGKLLCPAFLLTMRACCAPLLIR